MRPLAIVLLTLVTFGVAPCVVSGAETAIVEATGTGDTRDIAIDDALRKAVEKGAGVEVTSRTETLDHAVAFDKIVTRAKGYVSKYEVIDEKKKWDLFKITIRAEVNKGQLSDDWGEIQLVLERKGRPTVMVLLQETVFDSSGKAQEAMTEYAASAIEKKLLSKNFQLKSARGLEEIEKRQRDAAIAENNVDALAAICRRFGANVMIVGKSTCRHSGTREAHGGIQLHSYLATASVTAYNSDTGDLLLSLTAEGKGNGMGEMQAISLAFRKLSDRLSDEVLKELLNKWYFEFQHGAKIKLDVTFLADEAKGLRKAGRMAMRLEEALLEIEGVKAVNMGNYTKEAESALAVYTIDTTLSAQDLRKKLMFMDTEGAGFTLEWIGSDKNSLRFKCWIE